MSTTSNSQLATTAADENMALGNQGPYLRSSAFPPFASTGPSMSGGDVRTFEMPVVHGVPTTTTPLEQCNHHVTSAPPLSQPQTVAHGFPTSLPSDRHIQIPAYEHIRIPRYEYPADLTEGQFDVVLVYSEKDQYDCLQFKDIVSEFITLADGSKPRICVLDRNDNLQWKGARFGHMEEAIGRSTFMFIFMSTSLVTDAWADMMKDECLMESINNPKKRWCVVPLYPKKKPELKREGFKMPFGFGALKGIDISNMLKGRRLGDVDVSQLTLKDFDSFFLRNMTSMLSHNLLLKKEREREDARRLAVWLSQEKQRRYKQMLLENYQDGMRQQAALQGQQALIQQLQDQTYSNMPTVIEAEPVPAPHHNPPRIGQASPHSAQSSTGGTTNIYYNISGCGPVSLAPHQQTTVTLTNVGQAQIGDGNIVSEAAQQKEDLSTDGTFHGSCEIEETSAEPRGVCGGGAFEVRESNEDRNTEVTARDYVVSETAGDPGGVTAKSTEGTGQGMEAQENRRGPPFEAPHREPVEHISPQFPGDQPSGMLSVEACNRVPCADDQDVSSLTASSQLVSSPLGHIPQSSEEINSARSPVLCPMADQTKVPVAVVLPIISMHTRSVQPCLTSPSHSQSASLSSLSDSIPRYSDDSIRISELSLPREDYPFRHTFSAPQDSTQEEEPQNLVGSTQEPVGSHANTTVSTAPTSASNALLRLDEEETYPKQVHHSRNLDDRMAVEDCQALPLFVGHGASLPTSQSQSADMSLLTSNILTPASSQPQPSHYNAISTNVTEVVSCDEPNIGSCNVPAARSCDIPAARSCDVPAARSCDLQAARPCDVQAARPCDVQAARSCNVTAARSRDVPAARSCDIPAARSCDVPAARSCDLQAARPCDVQAARPCDVQAARSRDVPAARSRDIPAARSCDVQAVRDPGSLSHLGHQAFSGTTDQNTSSQMHHSSHATNLSTHSSEADRMGECCGSYECVSVESPASTNQLSSHHAPVRSNSCEVGIDPLAQPETPVDVLLISERSNPLHRVATVPVELRESANQQARHIPHNSSFPGLENRAPRKRDKVDRCCVQ